MASGKKMWRISYKVHVFTEMSGSMAVGQQVGGVEIYTDDPSEARAVVVPRVKQTPEVLRIFDVEATSTNIS